MPGRLDGKVAIITGAASGQGAAAARLFASEGARVVGVDINAEGLQVLQDDVQDILTLTCDLTDGSAVQSAVAEAVDTFGSINVLYNNAGVSIRRPGDWDETQDGPIADITEELFDKVFNINAKSQFFTCKYSIPHILEAGGGAIINVASIGGVFVGAAVNAYCVSKGAVAGLTRALAVTYGPMGIRSNCLCPGLIATPLVDHLLSDDEYMARYLGATPLRRYASAIEVATAGLFLASDDSSYLNGAVIPVDGGCNVRAPG